MAKLMTNNPPTGKKYSTNKENTKDFSKVYTTAQNKNMSKPSEFGNDTRAKAAAIKKDLGNDKLPRAPFGSEVHKQAVHKSLENKVAKIKSNNAGTGTTPTSRAGIDAAIKNEKTAADKYAASDDIKEDAVATAKKRADAKNPIFKK